LTITPSCNLPEDYRKLTVGDLGFPRRVREGRWCDEQMGQAKLRVGKKQGGAPAWPSPIELIGG